MVRSVYQLCMTWNPVVPRLSCKSVATLTLLGIPVPMTLLALAYMTSLFSWLLLLSWVSPADGPLFCIFLGFPVYLQLHLRAEFTRRHLMLPHATEPPRLSFCWNLDGNFCGPETHAFCRTVNWELGGWYQSLASAASPTRLSKASEAVEYLGSWTWRNHFLTDPV